MKEKNNEDLDLSSLDKSMFTIVGTNIEVAERITTRPYSYWKSVFKRVFKRPAFIISLILLLIVIVLASTVAIGEHATPTDSDIGNAFLPPSADHWFGTGRFGEDLWNKLWIGTRITLLFTLAVASIQIFLGVLIGSIWGYYSRLDMLFIEITRFLTLIPTLILWLIVIFLFDGSNSLGIMIFAVSLTSWVALSSIIRVQIMLTKNTEYNIASKVLGTPGHKIIRKNIMPKILPIIIQVSTFAIPNAIAIDSLLAFYGFGLVSSATPEIATLGSILNEVFSDSAWQVYNYLLIIPVSFIAGISLIFFFVGKVFADSLDPKTHR